jgi:hypothetical protein
LGATTAGVGEDLEELVVDVVAVEVLDVVEVVDVVDVAGFCWGCWALGPAALGTVICAGIEALAPVPRNQACLFTSNIVYLFS